jgi:hypothetical protein
MFFVALPLDDLQNVLCLRVAGNFAGHLEQAGETPDFINVKTASATAPKGLFPIYVPNDPGFLGVFPLSNDRINRPKTQAPAHLQAEPEMCVLFTVQYDRSTTHSAPFRVVNLHPLAFGAFNDCSIRQPNAQKISQKKNWGVHSKGIARQFIPLQNFTAGGELDGFRITAFLKRDGVVYPYGQDSSVQSYSYFYQTLITWMVNQLNQQTDFGPLEDLPQLLAQTDYPPTLLISLGATQYTAFGEQHFLQVGDQLSVALYDTTHHTQQDILAYISEPTGETHHKILAPLNHCSILQQTILADS